MNNIVYVVTLFNNISNNIMPNVLRVFKNKKELDKFLLKNTKPIKICKMNRLTGNITDITFVN